MARMSARQMWTAKLEGRPVPSRPGARARGAEAAGGLALRSAYAGVILGIDPSLRGTGIALVEFRPGCAPLLLRSATVRVPSSRTMASALAEIHRVVSVFIDDAPAIRHVALEQTIYVQNFRTAQIMGAARGAAIAAAAIRELPVFEYAPLRIKQAVTGSGRASKEQLARTLMAILGHGRTLAPDEADAAGAALCHAFTWRP